MQKIRRPLSLLMLALILFPMIEKAVHELEHLNDSHCEIKESHFCNTEHTCILCDYIFSSSIAPAKTAIVFKEFVYPSDFCITETVAKITNCHTRSLSLRGPPAC